MEVHYKITGNLLILLALLHLAFPKYFNWSKELAPLSLINRQMMYVHTLFIALILLLMGLLCLTSVSELISTSLGKKVTFGLGFFWLIRLLVQLFIYSTKLWRGKTLETFIHVVFLFLWSYLCLVFTAPWWLGS